MPDSGEGPYGIRTRAAAVRGRCPRPLDEWAVRRQGSEPSRALDGRIGLARVEPFLEVLAYRLSVREHGLVACAPGRELHDADVLVPVTVAAGVRRRLVEGPKAVALPLSPHYAAEVAEPPGKRNPGRPAVVQFATKTCAPSAARDGARGEA